MATHALIALQSHSSFHAAYLHFDGTPENLRPILHQLATLEEYERSGTKHPYEGLV